MKRLFILSITLLLVACGGGNQDQSTENTEKGSDEVENNIQDESADTSQETNHQENETNDKDESTNQNNNTDDKISNQEISDEVKELTEFPTIEDNIDLVDHQIDIVEDNANKRVLLIKNKNNEKTHKTIFIKNKQRLKIIEFDKGQIFNGII